MNIKSSIFVISPPFVRKIYRRIEESALGQRLARGILWSIMGAVVSRGMLIGAMVFVARMLGKRVYGELGIVQSTISMLGIFAGFGLGQTAMKYIASSKQSDPVRVGRIIMLSGIVAVIASVTMGCALFFSAPWVADKVLNASHLVGTLRIGALLIVLSILNGAQLGALSGFEAFKKIASINLLVGLLLFPILLLSTRYFGLQGAAWALTLNMFFNCVLDFLALRNETRKHNVPVTCRGLSAEFPVLWKFALPATLGTLLVTPVTWACGAILVNQPDGYSEMGIYNAANQWRMAILFIPATAGQIILPILSDLNAQNDGIRYLRVLKYNAWINIGSALLAASGVVILSPWIMRVYGPGFEKGVWVLVWLACSTVLESANSVIGKAIASQDKMWAGLAMNAFWAVVVLGVTYWAVRWGYGALGLAISALVAYTIHSIIQTLYLNIVLRRSMNNPLRNLIPARIPNVKSQGVRLED